MSPLLLLTACARVPVVGMLPCPATPNCVSSLAPADDEEHHIEPIHLGEDAGGAWERLDAAILAMPRVQRVTATTDYRHYTFKTALLRFTDDVEVRLDGDVAQIRSASRVGHSDLGVNRRRVEAIRAAMATAP